VRAAQAGYTGDHSTELTSWKRIGECYESMGDRRGCAIALVNQGYGWMMVGGFEEADAALRDAIRTSAALGMDRAVGAARHNLGMVLACRGDLEGAIREETAALATMVHARDDRLTLTSRLYLAAIYEMANDLERAEAVARQALDEIEGLPPLQPRGFAVLASILVKRGELQEAERLVARVRVALRGARVEGGDVFPRLVCVETLLACGKREEAEEVLREAKRALDHAASCIADPALRARFLSDVAENARTVALAREHGIA
jgi:tetratricopeptide (TPR) repeat protein